MFATLNQSASDSEILKRQHALIHNTLSKLNSARPHGGFCCRPPGKKRDPTTSDQTVAIRLIQNGLDRLGHAHGTVNGKWGILTERAIKQLLTANGRSAAAATSGPLPWITEAKTALGRNEDRDRNWLLCWLKRDGRSLGDPAKNPWCGDFVETCIRMGLPNEPLLGGLGTNPYWARNWFLFGQKTRPVVGAVLVFARGSGGHVGFAMGQDDTHFYLLGGNRSDAATVARVAKARLLGARWPRTFPLRPEPLPPMASGETLTTTNEI